MKFKIINLVKLVINNPFFSNSLVMVIGSNLYNGSQFVYHFIAGRFLGKAYYGDLAAIVSLLGIVGIVQLALGLTVVKFISAQKDKKEVDNFIKWIYFWSISGGAVIALMILAASPYLASFLHLHQPMAVFLLSPIMFFFLVTTFGRSVLQGLMRFDKYVFSLGTEAVIKILFTIIFILIGWAVIGALGAILMGIIISFLVTSFSLLPHLRGPRGKKPEIMPLIKYSSAVFIQGLALTSMYSMDLILVKHFFPADDAGIYASLAVLGRIAFFGPSPITHVMFPLISKRFHHGEPYHNIFYLSLILVTALSAIIVFVYSLFPKVALGVLYGEQFLSGAPLLWLFGIFMSLLGLAMLLVQFYLSIGKTKIVWLFVIAAILQIILIYLFHSTLQTVINVSIISASLLVISLLIYFPYHHKK